MFNKDNIVIDGDYVKYVNGNVNKFVVRFKHRGPVTKSKFIKCLMKHYTPETYFNKLDSGQAPLQILMNDGFLTYDSIDRKFTLDGKIL